MGRKKLRTNIVEKNETTYARYVFSTSLVVYEINKLFFYSLLTEKEPRVPIG
jgi:hypothetical protein